ncbi:MAG TPA: lamin tail domain-containing protein [Candidatus Thermoplasmatota archaeon]|nr:lamin tail domain-containing protein [Candidatus Thermoplasmatota archaeon]
MHSKPLLTRSALGLLGLALVLSLFPPATAQEDIASVQVYSLICSVPPDFRPEEGGENLRAEYVIFENTLTVPVDMTNWTLQNAMREDREIPDTYTFPEGFILLPGAMVTVHTGVGDDTPTDLYMDREVEFWFNDLLDGVILRNEEGEFVHSNECGSFAFGCPDVTATPLEGGAIRLDFGFGDAEEPPLWRLYRAEGDAVTFEEIAAVPGTVHTYVDGTVPRGETVRYIVLAQYETSMGQNCREVTVTSIPFFPGYLGGALAIAGCIGAYVLVRRHG